MRNSNQEKLALSIVRALEKDAEPKTWLPPCNFQQRCDFIKKFNKWRADNYYNLQAALNNADMFQLIFQQAKYSGKYTKSSIELIQQKV